MPRSRPHRTRDAGQHERDGGPTSPYSLDIEIDEREGRLRIYDPRAFHAGRRAFCRRLLEAAAEHPGLEKAEIDLDASVCLLDFDRDSTTARSMADVVTAAVHRAAAGRPGPDRAHWWSLPSRWSALTVYRTPEGDSWWETLETRPGQLQLRHATPSGDAPFLAPLAVILSTLDGIEASRASAWSHTLSLEYRPESPVAHGLLDVIEQIRQDDLHTGTTHRATARRHRQAQPGAIEVATGYRRLKYLALAGGSFAMTLIGLVVPGIPTVPFLLATSYYLARSSPRLNDRLRHTALFGPILVEWEEHRALSIPSKAKLVGLTTAIVLVTVALSATAPVVLIVILVIALISVYGIARLPGLPHETAASPRDRIALPAPSS